MFSFVLKHGRSAMVAGVLIAVSTIHLAAENSAPVLPDFTKVSWLPAAISVLTKASIAPQGITVAPENTGIQKTDTVTLLVQAVEGKNRQQWAVSLVVNELKPEEQQMRSAPVTLNLDSGHKVEFGPGPLEALAIHVLGPFSEAKGSARSKDVWGGALCNPQFLALGLDQTAALLRHLTQETKVQSPPQKRVLTETEEQVLFRFMPAMMDFFKITSQTPGVKDILFEVVNIPWWSIAAHGGGLAVNFELLGPFEELPPADWDLPPEMHVNSMGLRLHIYGKPALNCRLALTAPRVPLLNCAGIVGLAAMRPDGKGPYLMIRVMAASRAQLPK